MEALSRVLNLHEVDILSFVANESLALTTFFVVFLIFASGQSFGRSYLHWKTLHAICPSLVQSLVAIIWTVMSFPSPVIMVYNTVINLLGHE